MISQNMQQLRRRQGLTQEEVAARVGVSRQTVAKWEAGETVPDLANGQALADLFGVTLDVLVSYDEGASSLPVPPRGKHLFGVAKLGERGQIVIPKQARDIFGLVPGDAMMVLGDEAQGIALVKASDFLQRAAPFIDAAMPERLEAGTGAVIGAGDAASSCAEGIAASGSTAAASPDGQTGGSPAGLPTANGKAGEPHGDKA